MPLYEYFCPPCGSQFEVLRPISQMDSPAVCPTGHTTNNRVVSMFAFSKSGFSDVATMGRPQMMGGGDACCSTDSGGGGCSCC